MPSTSACRLSSVVTYVKPLASVASSPSGLTSVTGTAPVCVAAGTTACTLAELMKVTVGDGVLPK